MRQGWVNPVPAWPRKRRHYVEFDDNFRSIVSLSETVQDQRAEAGSITTAGSLVLTRVFRETPEKEASETLGNCFEIAPDRSFETVV